MFLKCMGVVTKGDDGHGDDDDKQCSKAVSLQQDVYVVNDQRTLLTTDMSEVLVEDDLQQSRMKTLGWLHMHSGRSNHGGCCM